MADLPRFPDIALPQYPLRDPLFLPKVRTDFESGKVQSRPRFTRSKRRFALKWERLPMEDRQTLEAFFTQIGSDKFIWTHPATGQEYTCIMSDDELDATWTELDDSDVNLNMEEA